MSRLVKLNKNNRIEIDGIEYNLSTGGELDMFAVHLIDASLNPSRLQDIYNIISANYLIIKKDRILGVGQVIPTTHPFK